MFLCGSDLDSGNFVKYFLVTDLRGQSGGAYRNGKPLKDTRKLFRVILLIYTFF